MYDQSDFESPTFDVTLFVDQLVEKSLSAGALSSSSASQDEFDSAKLYSVLSQTMTDLEDLNDKMQSELTKQQNISRQEIQDQMERVADLENQHHRCSDAFSKLEEDIMEISKKLVSLGDQLENISQPHTRISEAKLLIANFNQFMRSSFPKEKFLDEESMLPEYVDLLTKMKLVLSELDESKFQSAAGNIRSAHNAMESLLAEKFSVALSGNDTTSMSKYAKLLVRFECYSQSCVALFIDQLLSQVSVESEHLFDDILSKIRSIESKIQAVFEEPESVFNAYLNRLFLEVVQQHMDKALGVSSVEGRNVSMTKQQLELLSSFEVRVQRFCDRVSAKSVLVNKTSLNALRLKLFSVFVGCYVTNEINVLTSFCREISTNFYSARNHVKKNAQQLKAFGRKPFSETFDYPALVYKDEVAKILKEVKSCVTRASKLLNSNADKNDLGNKLGDVILSAIFDDNLIYVLSLISEGTPSTASDLRDLKSEPFLTYFAIVSRASSIVAEVNQLYKTCILHNPATGTGIVTSQGYCEEQRMNKLAEVENCINGGIEKTLNFYSAWIRKIYANQNLKEFQQMDDESIMHGPTNTCRQVCVFVESVIDRVHKDLKQQSALGGNSCRVSEILLQFGLKFHSNLLNQIQKLQVSLYGGIQISMDLSEYKKVAESFNIALLMKLFTSLQALCNLLITPAEHLSAVIKGPELEGFETNVVHDFVKLRVDYRRSELSRLFNASATLTASNALQFPTSI